MFRYLDLGLYIKRFEKTLIEFFVVIGSCLGRPYLSQATVVVWNFRWFQKVWKLRNLLTRISSSINSSSLSKLITLGWRWDERRSLCSADCPYFEDVRTRTASMVVSKVVWIEKRTSRRNVHWDSKTWSPWSLPFPSSNYRTDKCFKRDVLPYVHKRRRKFCHHFETNKEVAYWGM